MNGSPEHAEIPLRTLIDASGEAAQIDHIWVVDDQQEGAIFPQPPAPVDEPNCVYYVDLYSRGRLMVFVPEHDQYTACRRAPQDARTRFEYV